MGAVLAVKQVERIVPVDEIRWGIVIDRVATRFQLSYFKASSAVHSFHRRVRMFYPIAWFVRPKLSEIDNAIALTLSEILSADRFTLHQTHRVPVGVLQVHYSHQLSFLPGFRDNKSRQLSGTCEPELTLQIFGKTKTFSSVAPALTLYLLLLACAILSWIVFVETMLLGMAIFVLAVRYPHLMVEGSLRHYSWGLGLLCFLFGFAGLFGGTIKMAFASLREYRQKRK